MIRHHRSLSLRLDVCHIDHIHNSNNGWIGWNLSCFYKCMVYITKNCTAHNLGEISKLRVYWILAKYAIQTAFDMSVDGNAQKLRSSLFLGCFPADMLETDRREYYFIGHDRAILLKSNTVLCNRCLHKNYKFVAIILSTSMWILVEIEPMVLPKNSWKILAFISKMSDIQGGRKP